MRPALLATFLMGLVQAEEPVLHVKAHTRIDVASVTRVAGGIVVKGVLLDSALEEPIPGHTVAISVDGLNGFYRYAEPTRDDGSFRWRVPLPLGQYTLRLAAGGDEDYAAAPFYERSLDIDRTIPRITLIAPERVSVKQENLHVAIELREPAPSVDKVDQPEHPVELPVELALNGPTFATGVTHAGRLDLEI